MTPAQRRFWHNYALGGYGSFGPGTKATLKIGRKAGLTYGGWREGDLVSPASVFAAVSGRRAEQVGRGAVGYGVTHTEGSYKGHKEPSVSLELVWISDKKEKTRAAFFRNVKKLAQQVAGDLAQREVIVEWDAPGRRGRIDTATPTDSPASTNKNKFCAWVRRYSQSARKPGDDCFQEVKKGKRR